MADKIPANAYLTWEMVNRPTEPSPASGYIMFYNGADGAVLTTVPGDAQHWETEVPIAVGIHSREGVNAIGGLRVENGNIVECIKSAEWNKDGVTIEIEDIVNGTTRTISATSDAFMHTVNWLNENEGSNAIQNLGHAIDFQCNRGGGEDKTPEIKLHIPNT